MFDVANGARRAQKTQNRNSKSENSKQIQMIKESNEGRDALFATVSGFMDFIRV
jgi:hypothetical protein